MTTTDRGTTVEFSVHSKMVARPGQRTTLVARLRDIIEGASSTTGLLGATINEVIDDPDILWVTETWTDQLAHDTATRTDSNKADTERLMPLLAEPPTSFYGQVVYRHIGHR